MRTTASTSSGIGSSSDTRQIASPPAEARAPEDSIRVDAVKLDAFDDLAALAAEKRDIQLKIALERDVRPVRFDPAAGILEFALKEGAPRALAADLSRKLPKECRDAVLGADDLGAESVLAHLLAEGAEDVLARLREPAGTETD